jgi:glycosyltransferase involved in cell wall biosynthesis
MLQRVAIITPCFNENETCIRFLRSLEEVVGNSSYHYDVVVVDDCSNDNTKELLSSFRFTASNLSFKPITLNYNVGHQSAIYQGLLFSKTLDVVQIIILDSDGEDDPRGIPDLMTFEGVDIVHVKRGKRSESLSFRLSYIIYKIIFRFITGRPISFGNYCRISPKVRDVVVQTSFTHFAAYLSKLKVKRAYVRFDRLKRIDGKSKMNLSGLVYHAFKSFIEYSEEFLMLFLKLFLLIAACIAAIMTYVISEKLIRGTAVLGWASTLTAELVNTALICLGFFIMGILLLNIQSRRQNNSNNKIYTEI